MKQSRIQRLVVRATLIACCWCMASAGLAATQMSYSGPVTAKYYSSFTDTPTSGIIFNGAPYMTDTIASVSELRDYYAGADSDPNWPSAGNVFATDFTGSFYAPSAGNYSLLVGLDDGGYLTVNGVNYFNETGPNSVDFQRLTVPLSAGDNPFELQYYNAQCCGAIAYLGLNGASAPVPEPAAWAMMLLGAGLIGGGLRLARRKEMMLAGA